MSARKKQWVLREPAPESFLKAQSNHSALVATLLYQRGLHDSQAISDFLSSDYRNGLHDPFLMKDMATAADRIKAAIEAGEPIAVYGDFDTDGVTAVTLLVQVIGAMGGDIRPYIPHRMREGYGLNTEAIDALAGEGVRLLITVDCGISNISEVAYAHQCGLDVVVTDHHTPPQIVPDALAVVNPKQADCNYPYKGLVGVGIAYKLVQALTRRGLRMPLRGRDLLDVVALGTVADMGPLTGENRVLVKAGLEALNSTSRPGLLALIAEAGLVPGKITAGDIGYMLGPRLNAAGRIDDARLAYQLLLADNLASAQRFARALNDANVQRQQLSREVQRVAMEDAQSSGRASQRIVLLANEEYPAGVVGLVAARLADELGRPVILVERGAATSRGSARGVPGFSVIDALNACSELFVRYGGHAGAAGFTIESDRLEAFEQALLEYAVDRLPEVPAPQLEIDAEVPLDALNWLLLEELATLEPFGQANQQPILMSSKVRIIQASTRGAERQHLKLRLDNGQGGQPYEAIAFRLGHLAGYFERHPWLDIAYTFEKHEWNGQRSLQLNIKDLRRASS